MIYEQFQTSDDHKNSAIDYRFNLAYSRHPVKVDRRVEER